MADARVLVRLDVDARTLLESLRSQAGRPTWQFGPDAPEHPAPCRWPDESCRGHVAVDNPVDNPVDAL